MMELQEKTFRSKTHSYWEKNSKGKRRMNVENRTGNL
jgi:hypothetical protein